MVWSQIKRYVASRNATSTSLLNMRQLVLEAFDSITQEYCRKVCERVRRLEETTLEAEMAMDPIVERMIIEVDSSGDEDVVSDDEEEEETPPNLTNTKSDEDQIIQKVIREHNKIYPRRKSDQYAGCACKGYCNTKKCRCVSQDIKYEDCRCLPNRCSNRTGGIAIPSPATSSDRQWKRRRADDT